MASETPSQLEKKLGELLEAKREYLGLNQPQFGELLGVKRNQIARYKDGLDLGWLPLVSKIKELLKDDFIKILDLACEPINLQPSKKVIIERLEQLYAAEEELKMIKGMRSLPQKAEPKKSNHG